MTERLNQTISQPFRVICTDDEWIDEQIDEDQRIKKGNEYIVTNVFTNLIGDGDDSFKLLGIDPDPYKGYGAYRFKPSQGNYNATSISVN